VLGVASWLESETMSATNRILLGALAGIAATCAMTAAARAMHRRLPASERYSLPPARSSKADCRWQRSALSTSMGGRRPRSPRIGYGAVTGALYALAAPRGSTLSGAAYGVLVWVASYFEIMPGLRVLRPAHDHPARRNALMIRGTPGLGQHAGEDAARPRVRGAGNLCG
jgi:hypothetical protein